MRAGAERSRRLAAGLVLVLSLWACGEDAAPEGRLERAPEFDLERIDGGRVRLADLRGRIVLIDFWATWCPPCVREIPELNAVWDRYRGRGVEVLALSVDDLPPAELAEWAREHEIAYPVALASLDLAVAYGGSEFPFHVVVDREGNLRDRLPSGAHDREELSRLIERYR